MNLAWGYATPSDIDQFYDGRPEETMRAVVIRMDGRAVGVIGLAREPDCERAFSEYKPELAPHLRSLVVMRALKAFMKWVEASRVPVYAVSEGTGILEKLGFRQVDGERYEWAS